jgi:hypothetical protein
MENTLSLLGTKLYEDGLHRGFLIKWKTIEPLCKKWSRNRNVDNERVKEMIEYYEGGGYIPRIIHLAELEAEGLACYDGNHRREVFSQVDADFACVVDIMFGANQTQVYDAFNNINKSVQLPAIYIETGVDDIRDEIVDLVRLYEVNYKSFISPSARCHSPNFNRDNFVDNIYAIYKMLNNANGQTHPRLLKDVYGIAHIKVILEKLNDEYANERICKPHSYYKKNAIDKCKKYGLWLFIEHTIPFEHVEKAVVL